MKFSIQTFKKKSTIFSGNLNFYNKKLEKERQNQHSYSSEFAPALEKINHVYNAVRPHYALEHLTPDEAYAGIELPDIAKNLKLARAKRMKKNRNSRCRFCTC